MLEYVLNFLSAIGLEAGSHGHMLRFLMCLVECLLASVTLSVCSSHFSVLAILDTLAVSLVQYCFA